MPLLDMRKPDKKEETIGVGPDDEGNFRVDQGFGREDCITILFTDARSARIYFMNILRAAVLCMREDCADGSCGVH